MAEIIKDISRRDYYPFPESAIKADARNIQQRVINHKKHGYPVTSDMVWGWIKEARPTWPELEREKVFQQVKL